MGNVTLTFLGIDVAGASANMEAPISHETAESGTVEPFCLERPDWGLLGHMASFHIQSLKSIIVYVKFRLNRTLVVRLVGGGCT